MNEHKQFQQQMLHLEESIGSPIAFDSECDRRALFQWNGPDITEMDPTRFSPGHYDVLWSKDNTNWHGVRRPKAVTIHVQ